MFRFQNVAALAGLLFEIWRLGFGTSALLGRRGAKGEAPKPKLQGMFNSQYSEFQSFPA
jgi:hypothetical protein